MTDDELERIRAKKMAELLARKETSSSPVQAEPVHVTDINFEQFISSNRLVVVDFWAEWCAPCRAIAPIIQQLAKQYAGKVVFGKLNVDENPVTASKYGIMSIPTLLFFLDGGVVDFIIGAVPKRNIEAKIQNLQ